MRESKDTNKLSLSQAYTHYTSYIHKHIYIILLWCTHLVIAKLCENDLIQINRLALYNSNQKCFFLFYFIIVIIILIFIIIL